MPLLSLSLMPRLALPRLASLPCLVTSGGRHQRQYVVNDTLRSVASLSLLSSLFSVSSSIFFSIFFSLSLSPFPSLSLRSLFLSWLNPWSRLQPAAQEGTPTRGRWWPRCIALTTVGEMYLDALAARCYGLAVDSNLSRPSLSLFLSSSVSHLAEPAARLQPSAQEWTPTRAPPPPPRNAAPPPLPWARSGLASWSTSSSSPFIPGDVVGTASVASTPRPLWRIR